ncbi:hypothetical protein IP88_01770 [alpha proteobacterium AAP81b]|nr:hypothetical protein IP88_01770 [alpha proteobacterium AAP81b]
MVDFLERIPKPSKLGINQGLTTPTASFLLQELGNPREDYTGECQNPTNPAFKKLVATRDVGPFRATGLIPALESLKAVLADVRNELPELHDSLSSEGMLCCRFRKINGKAVAPPSSHSWGTAIDLKISNVLDRQGDNMTLRGLALLAKFFNAHGWIWGVSFPTEDAMHFEVSREKLKQFRDAGLL